MNGLDTPWHADDIAAAAEAGPAGVVVPKVNSADDVHAIVDGLQGWRAGPHQDLGHGRDARGHARRGRHRRRARPLAVLVMGTNDLAKELHAEHVPGRQPLLTGLGLCLLAARAAGKVILDGVYNDITDAAGFEAECLQGRQLGFDGKTLIHPSQIEPANGCGPPRRRPSTTPAAHRHVRRRHRLRQGRGHPQGRMIENLHVDNARRVLAVADAIAART